MDKYIWELTWKDCSWISFLWIFKDGNCSLKHDVLVSWKKNLKCLYMALRCWHVDVGVAWCCPGGADVILGVCVVYLVLGPLYHQLLMRSSRLFFTSQYCISSQRRSFRYVIPRKSSRKAIILNRNNVLCYLFFASTSSFCWIAESVYWVSRRGEMGVMGVGNWSRCVRVRLSVKSMGYVLIPCRSESHSMTVT